MSVYQLRAGIVLILLNLVLLALAGQTPVAAQPPLAEKEVLDEKTIRRLINQLGDDSYVKREAAQKRLSSIGLPALELLRKAAKEGTDLETRERASQLVQEIGQLLFLVVLKDKQWGDSVDPDGDCRFRVDLGKLHIKIPGKPHRLGIELGATNSPRVMRAVQGDFHAEVQVDGAFPSASGSLVGKYPWYGAGLLVWQDDKNYIRLERARMDFNPDNRRCYTNWELRREGTHARKGVAEDGLLDETKPAFFRLDRQGAAFTAACSQDGKKWKELSTINVDFTKKLFVGVTASQNTSLGYEAVFDSLKVTPGKLVD